MFNQSYLYRINTYSSFPCHSLRSRSADPIHKCYDAFTDYEGLINTPLGKFKISSEMCAAHINNSFDCWSDSHLHQLVIKSYFQMESFLMNEKTDHICMLLMFILTDEQVLFLFFCQIKLWSSIKLAYV